MILGEVLTLLFTADRIFGMMYFFFLFCIIFGIVKGIWFDEATPGFKPSRNLLDFFFPGMYD